MNRTNRGQSLSEWVQRDGGNESLWVGSAEELGVCVGAEAIQERGGMGH